MTDILPISNNSSAVAQTPSRATVAREALTDDLDTFLTLLTQQLQYQDPLEPMDTNQFVDQLTQFSELEQGVEGNQYLEDIAGALTSGDRQAELSYLGRVVEAESETISLTPAGANFAYNITSPTDRGEIRIFDQTDRLVARYDIDGDVGRSTFGWDGQTEDGVQAAPGLYRAQVVARPANEDGQARLAGTTLTSGTVREVRYNGAQTELILDEGMIISPDDVQRVTVSETGA